MGSGPLPAARFAGPVDCALTGRVKSYAFAGLNADLVGIANIERFEHAPPLMSPQGIMPTARSVVVMALHHPDACIELGGQEHPQEIGPYRVQYLMNSRLDEISYRMALYLERAGYRAVPIVSSNIWRYKGYKGLTEHFAPDLSHRHAAVAAGLADFGFSALAITPEHGARVRFVTVVTDAVLTPDPLLEPGSVCDSCGECVATCPTGALREEIAGTSVVRIEDKEYTYADKNLWRCAWGEHFDLDLDLPIPERVDEAVILEQVAEHGFRGGEMGCCLRYCLPAERRYEDRSYTNTFRRRRNSPAGDEPNRGFEGRLTALAYGHGCDFVTVQSAAQLAALGLDPTDYLPDGQMAVTVGLRYRQPGSRRPAAAETDDVSLMTAYHRPEGDDPARPARTYLLESAAYDLTRELERRGYSAVCCSAFPEDRLQAALAGVDEGWAVQTATVITSADLATTPLALPAVSLPERTPEALREQLESLATELGADLFGVSPAARLEAVQEQLAELFDGEEVLVARDKSSRFRPYEPEVVSEPVRTMGPNCHLAGARSVVVLGLRLPAEAVACTAQPPAEAVGPLAFAQYESVNLLRLMGYRLQRLLEDQGHRATLTFDLCGTGSFVGNPRGNQPDAFANRFAATAAGLASLGTGGFPLTARFGPNVRFVAVVTDAELPADEVAPPLVTEACAGCRACLDADPADAYTAAVTVSVGGVPQRFTRHLRSRSDWAWRYSLHGDSGVNWLGWGMPNEVPAEITAESLATALRTQPPVAKYRPVNVELPVLACPLAGWRGA